MSISESTRAAKRQRLDVEPNVDNQEPLWDAVPQEPEKAVVAQEPVENVNAQKPAENVHAPEPGEAVNAQEPPEIEIVEEPEKKYWHHETYWVKEGNLIVVAKGNRDPVAFKILSSVLADNSPALAKLIANADKSVTYCSFPILFLEEPAIDVEAVLQWLFSKAFKLSLPKQMKLRHVFAFHRLGIQYELEDMRKEALIRLETCFPASWDGYRQRPGDNSPDRPVLFTLRQEFNVIAFCCIYHLHSCLPAALVECCNYTLRDLPAVKHNVSHYGKTIDGMAPWHWVSHCVMLGSSLLSTARVNRTRALLRGDVAPSCAKPDSCRPTLKTLARKILAEGQDDTFLPHDLSRLDNLCPTVPRPCSLCWALQVKKWDEAIQKVWEDLPTIFRFREEPLPVET